MCLDYSQIRRPLCHAPQPRVGTSRVVTAMALLMLAAMPPLLLAHTESIVEIHGSGTTNPSVIATRIFNAHSLISWRLALRRKLRLEVGDLRGEYKFKALLGCSE
eukprot:6209453-Pleurochrysis_carterae.AAC.4